MLQVLLFVPKNVNILVQHARLVKILSAQAAVMVLL